MTIATTGSSRRKRETCALLGFFPSPISEEFKTTADVIASASTKDKEIAALLKPQKLLGDYDVSAGLEGTPEVTKTYLKMTPGQVCERLNNIVNKNLQETTMNTHYTEDEGSKLKSFSEFPVGRTDLDDVVKKANTPTIVTTDYRGTEVHPALKGTSNQPPTAATTVEMTPAKERALKRVAEFISSYHGNNQQTIATKEVF